MNISMGQIFRVSRPDASGEGGFPDLRTATQGRHPTGIDINKGMFFYTSVEGRDGRHRRPAFIFSSNSLRPVTELNPWLDVIEPDLGRALYHGDNRTPGRGALESRGNRAFTEVLGQYADPESRKDAPPVLLFDQALVDGRAKGFRTFAGVAAPIGVRLQTQAAKSGRFTNLAIDLVVLGLESESDSLDWGWIDDRRDPSLSSDEANRRAPRSWRAWMKEGAPALGRLRRSVVRSRITPARERRTMPGELDKLLREIHAYHIEHRHGFEGLASFVTQKVIGASCIRGWVTPRSGDGGIDFVSRLDVGSGMAATSAVVLGQAKSVMPGKAIPGTDLARVVARLRRGWIGAFVTTGVFSDRAQQEVIEDEYPLVLIDGRRLAEEVREELVVEGLSLGQLLRRELSWYDSSVRRHRPEQILSGDSQGVVMWPGTLDV